MTSPAQVGSVTLKDQGRAELLLQHFPARGCTRDKPSGKQQSGSTLWLGFPKRGWVI